MRKSAVRLLLVALFVSLFVPAFVSVVRADCPTVALPNDNSTSVNGRAPSTRWRANRAVYLILASELTANNIGTGSISGIGWNYQLDPGVSGAGSLKVYLQDTTDTVYSKGGTFSGAIVGMTLVHNATTTLPAGAGEFDFAFSGGSPFSHTAGRGVYVAFDWSYTGTLSTTTVTFCNSLGLIGGLRSNQSTTSSTPVDALGAASNFRPETWLKAPGAPLLDVSVDFVMSMGAIPLGLVGDQTIQATVFQNGDSDITNTDVNLDLAGADVFSDMVTVPSLLRCGTGGSVVSFAPWTPATLGANAVTGFVSVAGDADSSNDSLTELEETTPQRYSYQHASKPTDGGIGFTTAGAELSAWFNFTAPTQIDSVDADFSAASAATYRISIRADDGSGSPGASLYLDSANRTITSAGKRTVRLDSPLVLAAGDYYVGIQQQNVTNPGVSVNNEFPVRAGSFYGSTTPNTLGSWFEFSSDGDEFALNIGLNVGSCIEPMSVDVTPDASAPVACNNNVTLSAGTSGGFGNLTYQWTRNGIDIPGATNFTLNESQASGTFSYNCKVTDDAGCVNVADGTAVVQQWGPSAAASGGGAICAGGSVNIQAALTGTGPWNLTWSDGFVQSGVASSPAIRSVSPGTSTVYTVTSVTDANCAGTASGSASVTVNPTPAETSSANLNWTDKTTTTWDTNPDAGTYNLYRGAGTSLPNLLTAAIDSCKRYSGAAATATGLIENPPADSFDWYLVTTTSAATCEGGAGAATVGARIVNSSGTCP